MRARRFWPGNRRGGLTRLIRAPRANLKFARQVAQVDEPQLKWFETASTWLPPEAWVWLAGSSLWLAAGMLTLPGFFRQRKSGWQQTLAALGLGIFLSSVTANLGVVSRTQLGFVLKKDAPLLLTPTRESEAISTLNAGEPARRIRTRGDYFFVRTAFATGWIRRNNSAWSARTSRMPGRRSRHRQVNRPEVEDWLNGSWLKSVIC